MRDGVTALALGLVIGITAGPCERAEAIEAGTMVDQSNVDQVKDQLPPEIYNHFKKGEYANKLVDFPNSRWSWDDGFAEATKWNAEHLVLDEHKSPIDKDTRTRPDYIRGLPFPDIREDDPEAGYKALWNLDYAYYTGGNSHNLTLLNWVSRSGVDRASVQDVFFLYYEGLLRVPDAQSIREVAAVTSRPSGGAGARRRRRTEGSASRPGRPCLRRCRPCSPGRASS